jgi:hypothetical protein
LNDAGIILAALEKRRTPPHAFYGLDDFARGYVEAMFFTNGDTGSEDEDLLNRLGVERLTRASVKAIARDCGAFLNSDALGGKVRLWLDDAPQYDDAQAGRDFWFTRQGHGVSFMDRDELTQSQSNALTAAAHAMGETSVEVWRGWVHCR